MTRFQAILSQFSRRFKAKSADSDTLDVDEDEMFATLEDGAVGDEEPGLEEDSEEIAGDVAASDQAMIDDIIEEVELDGRLSSAPLSPAGVRVGCFAIAKVRGVVLWFIYADLVRHSSFARLLTKSSIAQQSRRILKLNASVSGSSPNS